MCADGVFYSVWAPLRRTIAVEIYGHHGQPARSLQLERESDGYFRGKDLAGRPGDCYKLRPDAGMDFPSPASHFQPLGVHGPSEVVDHLAYRWRDAAWQRPAWRDLIIYELHIGTFTPEGTFAAAASRLPYLRDLGINAIEIMPLADFPGERGWGYDGVQLYAPARCYGRPDDFRALVDAAHEHGIAVILDVVYNHFGPDGNYTGQFSPFYLEHEDKTPWGDAINFGREHSAAVREFYKANLLYWMEYFHIDGFRLDATHAIADQPEHHILAEFADLVHSRGGYIIAEDERNEARIITARDADGFGMDGVWADDFHHSIEVATVPASRYHEEFKGDIRELVSSLHHGWIYRGQTSARTSEPRGTECRHLPPDRFILCISNHDQIGNRAFGERLNQLVDPATYRAASALLLLSPYTPMLFQGQEWAPSTPFLYFTDHNSELGRLVEEGRRAECRFAIFASGATDIPSPQAESTFAASQLKWDEATEGLHGQTLELYRELIRLRKAHAAFRPATRNGMRVTEIGPNTLAMRIGGIGEEWLLICNLKGPHSGGVDEHDILAAPPGCAWTRHLSSNEPRFGGGEPLGSFDPGSGRFTFRGPETLLFRALS